MAGVEVTALIMSFALPILFLAMVAMFSFYSAFAAYRVLNLRIKVALYLVLMMSSQPSAPEHGNETEHSYENCKPFVLRSKSNACESLSAPSISYRYV